MSDEIHFKPEAKRAFRYHRGYSDEVTSADPLALRGQLRIVAMQNGTTIDKLIDGVNAVDAANSTDEQIAEGWRCTLLLGEIVKAVFQLDESTDLAHALGCIRAFYGYLEKKNQAAA